MPTKTTIKEIINLLSKIDVLEIICQQIDKSQSDPAKKSSANNFKKEAEKFIKEQRDVILLALKIKWKEQNPLFNI